MKRRREFVVGVTVVAAIIAVAAGALWLSQTSLNRDQVVRSARFREVGGLKPGAPVTLARREGRSRHGDPPRRR